MCGTFMSLLSIRSRSCSFRRLTRLDRFLCTSLRMLELIRIFSSLSATVVVVSAILWVFSSLVDVSREEVVGFVGRVSFH